MGDVHAQLSYDVTFMETLKNYLFLTKPGIVLGNLIAAAGGFLLTSRGDVDTKLFFSLMTGISLVIASGCVFNNFIDREIDRVMPRTRTRTMVRGAVAPSSAIIFSLVLVISGLAILFITASLLCTGLIAFGFTVYVLFYSLFLKRRSIYASCAGSLAGAVPPVAGYCAVAGYFDPGAWILFFIFVLWQLPHCYTFAILRFEDYLAAGIPATPVILGITRAKRHIFYYTGILMAASLMLTLTGFTGFSYLAVAALLGTVWLYIAWTGLKTSDERRWAGLMFKFSFIYIAALSFMMSVDWKI